MNNDYMLREICALTTLRNWQNNADLRKKAKSLLDFYLNNLFGMSRLEVDLDIFIDKIKDNFVVETINITELITNKMAPILTVNLDDNKMDEKAINMASIGVLIKLEELRKIYISMTLN